MPGPHEFLSARPESEFAADAVVALPPLNQVVDHVVGSTRTLITRPPSNLGLKRVALQVEAGAFRVAAGDRSSDTGFTAAAPSATTYEDTLEEGGGGLLLQGADVRVMPMPSQLTVVGNGAGAVLTFWFLP